MPKTRASYFRDNMEISIVNFSTLKNYQVKDKRRKIWKNIYLFQITCMITCMITWIGFARFCFISQISNPRLKKRRKNVHKFLWFKYLKTFLYSCDKTKVLTIHFQDETPKDASCLDRDPGTKMFIEMAGHDSRSDGFREPPYYWSITY
jgi:hypothetical protein